MDRHVVLLGLMGSGKTSIGRLVAAGLGRPLVEGDAHMVVWLAASPELLADKAGRTPHRPLPEDADLVTYFRRQLAIREPMIAPLDPLVVDVVGQDDHAAAALILDAVGRATT